MTLLSGLFGAEDIAQIKAEYLPWQELQGKAILLTGAGGFLASRLFEALRLVNIEYALDLTFILSRRRHDPSVLAMQSKLSEEKVILHEQDIGKPFMIDRHVDILFHASSPATPSYYGTHPVETIIPNTIFLHSLLDYASRSGSLVFFFSSGSVYGRPQAIPIAENDYGFLDPVDTRSCYAESKRMGETLCKAWSHQYGASTRIARIFHTYGPGIALGDGRIYSDLIRDYLFDLPLTLYGDGAATRCFAYVTDTLLGLLYVLLKGDCATPYNVGNEEAEVSMSQFASILAAMNPGKVAEVRHLPPRSAGEYLPSSVTRTVPCTDRLRSLGWRPRVDLQAGLARTLRSFCVS